VRSHRAFKPGLPPARTIGRRGRGAAFESILLDTGELVTKPLRFDGSRLEINFSTSAAGSVRVEIQDPHSNPIPGFTLADCDEQFGDELDRVVSWKRGPGVSELSGKTVRLRFELKDADLYSFQFTREAKP
jgi:hypothetical protein